MKNKLPYVGLFLSISIYGMEHSVIENIIQSQFHENLHVQGNEGLLAGTLVKVPFGYIAIEDLEIGDRVISRNEHGILETDFVVGIEQKKVQEVVQFIVDGEPIVVANDHKFFTPQLKRWIKAHQIAYGDTLMSFPYIDTPLEAIEIIKGEFEVVSISIENNHNFFVSEKDLLVHNMFPAAVAMTATTTTATTTTTTAPAATTAVSSTIATLLPVVGGVVGVVTTGTLIVKYLKNKAHLHLIEDAENATADTIAYMENATENTRTNVETATAAKATTAAKLEFEFIPIFIKFLSYEVDVDEEYHYPYLDNQTTFINSLYFYEFNKCNLEYWTPEMYREQWREGLKRLKTHNNSCLVISIPNQQNPDDTVNVWALYRIGDTIHIQNHYLDYNIYGNKTITPENCYDFFIEPREVFTESGMKISEWVVPIIKISLGGLDLEAIMQIITQVIQQFGIEMARQLAREIAKKLRIQNISSTFINKLIDGEIDQVEWARHLNNQ